MKQRINQKNTAMDAISNQSLESTHGYKNVGNTGLQPGRITTKGKK